MPELNLPKLLVVEDELNVGSTLEERLRNDGFDVSWAKTKEEALVYLKNSKLDLLVLDVGLPDGNGFEVAQESKKIQPWAAVLFLTAFGTPEDRIQGLSLGAEDYIVKPFHYKELLLRIQNGLKRARYLSSLSGTKEETVVIGLATIHFPSFTATVNGEKISLTHKECSLLKFLIERRGKVVSRDEILNFVWSEEEFPSARTVDNFIVRLRRLIEMDPTNPEIITSVRGVGYQLN